MRDVVSKVSKPSKYSAVWMGMKGQVNEQLSEEGMKKKEEGKKKTT